MIWLALFLFLLGISVAEGQTLKDKFDLVLQNVGPVLDYQCLQHLSEYVANLTLDESSWSLQMLDATSKIPSGLMSLHFGDLGHFDQCTHIKADQISGKYCLGFLAVNENTTAIPPPYNLGNISVGSLGLVTQYSQLPNPTWAVCVPHKCSSADINIFVNYFFSQYVDKRIAVGFSDMLCQTVEDVYPQLTTGAIITIAFLLLLVLLVIASSFYEIYCMNKIKEPNHCFTIFSAYSNGSKIFKISRNNPEQFPCLNGIRFISMIWVMAAHQFSLDASVSLTNVNELIQFAAGLESMFLASGSFAVDTFLVVTGFLMAYGFVKSRYKNVPFNVLIYYLHRYLRLTPPLAVVVLVSSTLLIYLGSGPNWPLVGLFFQSNCVDYWWSAILYVQNYVNITEMCVGQTWYLAIDMQLFIVSPIVFFILWRWPKIAVPLLFLAILGFIGASLEASLHYNLVALLTNLNRNGYNYSNYYYLLTHTRGAPWVIGVIFGFFVGKMKFGTFKLQINKFMSLFFWCLTLALLLLCVLIGHGTLRDGEYDKWGNALYIALIRPAWALANSWLILACITGRGGVINCFLSLPIYQVLNRFTYGLYLTHVSLLYLMSYAKKWPEYFSPFYSAFHFWGTFAFSMMMTAFLLFAVEYPTIAIENVIFGKGRIDKKTVIKDAEKGISNGGFEKQLE